MTPAAIEQSGKEELKEELLKIKARQKRIQEETKEKTSRAISVFATIGSAGLAGWFMGSKEKEVRDATPEFDTLPQEEKTKKLQEKQAVMGLDYDLLGGIVFVALGLTDSAGEWSGPIGAIGTGALSSFASRMFYNSTAKAPPEEAPQP